MSTLEKDLQDLISRFIKQGEHRVHRIPKEQRPKVKLKSGNIVEVFQVATYPDRACPTSLWTGDWFYGTNGVRIGLDMSPWDIKEVVKESPEERLKQDLEDLVRNFNSSSKPKVRLRDGSIVTVEKVDDSNLPIKADRLWYDISGKDWSTEAHKTSRYDIVEVVKTEGTANMSTAPQKSPKTVESFFRQYEKTGKLWENGLTVTLRDGREDKIFAVLPKALEVTFPVQGGDDSYTIDGRVDSSVEEGYHDIVAIPSEGIFPDSAATVLQEIVSLIKGSGYIAMGVHADPLAPLLKKAERILAAGE